MYNEQVSHALSKQIQAKNSLLDALSTTNQMISNSLMSWPTLDFKTNVKQIKIKGHWNTPTFIEVVKIFFDSFNKIIKEQKLTFRYKTYSLQPVFEPLLAGYKGRYKELSLFLIASNDVMVNLLLDILELTQIYDQFKTDDFIPTIFDFDILFSIVYELGKENSFNQSLDDMVGDIHLAIMKSYGSETNPKNATVFHDAAVNLAKKIVDCFLDAKDFELKFHPFFTRKAGPDTDPLVRLQKNLQELIKCKISSLEKSKKESGCIIS